MTWTKVYVLEPEGPNLFELLQTDIIQLCVKEYVDQLGDRPLRWHYIPSSQVTAHVQENISQISTKKSAIEKKDNHKKRKIADTKDILSPADVFKQHLKTLSVKHKKKPTEDITVWEIPTPPMIQHAHNMAVQYLLMLGYFVWREKKPDNATPYPHMEILHYTKIQLWYHTEKCTWAVTDARENKQAPTNTPWNITFLNLPHIYETCQELSQEGPYLPNPLNANKYRKSKITPLQPEVASLHPVAMAMMTPGEILSDKSIDTKTKSSPYIIAKTNSRLVDVMGDIIQYRTMEHLDMKRNICNANHTLFTTVSTDLRSVDNSKYPVMYKPAHGTIHVVKASNFKQELVYRNKSIQEYEDISAQDKLRTMNRKKKQKVTVGGTPIDIDPGHSAMEIHEAPITDGKQLATTNEGRHLQSSHDNERRMRELRNNIFFKMGLSCMIFGLNADPERSGAGQQVAEAGMSRDQRSINNIRSVIEPAIRQCTAHEIEGLEFYVRPTHQLSKHDISMIRQDLKIESLITLLAAQYDIPPHKFDSASMKKQRLALETSGKEGVASKQMAAAGGTPRTGNLDPTNTEQRRKQSHEEKKERSMQRGEEPST